MKHDEKKIDAIMSLADKRSIDDLSCGIDFVHCDEALREYAEHQDRWLTTDELPESDTFVTLICKEEFNDMGDHPITAHYYKDRNLFAENGEEIPHGAIRFYKVVTMPESAHDSQ